MSADRLRIAMVAPPWIEVPPEGYGGVEVVIGALVDALQAEGHEVELFTVGSSTAKVARSHAVYAVGRYERLHSLFSDAAAVPVAHLLSARQAIERDGGFDITHDHNYLLGPPLLAGSGGAPLLHTLHGVLLSEDVPGGPVANLHAHELIAQLPGVYLAGISRAQVAAVPATLRERVLGVAYNGIELRPTPENCGRRQGFVTLARFVPEKGHDVAARLCAQLGAPLRLAGAVGLRNSTKEVFAAADNLGSAEASDAELRHFVRDVRPHLRPGLVEYVGAVGGARKSELLGRAEALLMPIRWEEPFGVSAVEALAHGTPVVAFARGALPEIIDHGVTGFLVQNEAEFLVALNHVGDIDPDLCRKSVSERFSGAAMARSYVRLYREAIRRAGRAADTQDRQSTAGGIGNRS